MSPVNGDAGQNQNPGNNYQNPAGSYQNQGNNFQDQGNSYQNPGNNFQNPGNNFQNLGSSPQNPGGSPQNTGTPNQNTGAPNQNIGAPSQNAGTAGQNSGTAGQNTGNTGNPGGTPLTGQSNSGNDSWKNDPSLKNMDLKKLAFLSELVSQSGSQSMDSLLPFLMAANKNANSMGMQFNDSETDLILNVLKSRMKPGEQSRIDMIRKMADMLGRR